MKNIFIDYLKNSGKDLKESFMAIRLSIFIIALYDLLFYISLGGILYIAVNSVRGNLTKIYSIEMTEIVANPAAANSVLSALKSFMIQLGSTIIVSVLIMILAWSIFKGLSWAVVQKKKVTLSYLWGFFLTNLVWFLSLSLILVFLIYSAKQDAALSVIKVYFLLIFHFTWIVCLAHTKYGKIGQSIKRALHLGTVGIYHLIIPYFMVLVTALVFGQALFIVKSLSQTSKFIGVGLWLLLLFAFAKIYFAKALERYI